MVTRFISRLLFNTGRQYSAEGQPVLAFQAVKDNVDEDCCILFHDVARGIYGELPASIEFTQSAIMTEYDAGRYSVVSPFDSEAEAVKLNEKRAFRILGADIDLFRIGIFKDGKFTGFFRIFNSTAIDDTAHVFFKDREAAEDRLTDAGWFTEDEKTWRNEFTSATCVVVKYRAELVAE